MPAHNADHIRSNYETHGLKFTLEWARRKRINLDTVSYVLFGQYGLLCQ